MLPIIFAAIVAAASGMVTRCPEHYSAHDDSCYIYVPRSLDYYDALKICETYGAILAQSYNQATDDYLASLIPSGVPRVWLGATDILKEGDFRFVKNYAVVGADFDDWAAGEPNNQGGNENCMEMRPDAGNKWNDVPCDLTRPFICQKYMYELSH